MDCLVSLLGGKFLKDGRYLFPFNFGVLPQMEPGI